MTALKAARFLYVAILAMACTRYVSGKTKQLSKPKTVGAFLQTSQHAGLDLKKAGGGGKSSSKGAKATPASELCGKSGKGGRYCWPMKRYPILGMKLSPFFIGCCQPCPEKMLSLIHI